MAIGKVKRKLSTNKFLAVVPPVLNKIEARPVGGIVMNDTRSSTVALDLVMDYRLNEFDVLQAGRDKVIVRGDSGAKQWSKQVFRHGDQEFVLCPEGDVLGYEVEE